MAVARAIVQCSNCGTPGAVVFDGDEIKNAFFPCKCPRPTVEAANKEILATSPSFVDQPKAASPARPRLGWKRMTFQEGTRPSP